MIIPWVINKLKSGFTTQGRECDENEWKGIIGVLTIKVCGRVYSVAGCSLHFKSLMFSRIVQYLWWNTGGHAHVFQGQQSSSLRELIFVLWKVVLW